MKKAFLMLMALGLFSATNLRADITYLSENFNELAPAPGVTSAGAFSTIGGTNVDVLGGSADWGYLCDFAGSPFAPSGNCVDMRGSAGNPAGKLQSNSLFAAGTYDLSFDLLGSQRFIPGDPSIPADGIATMTTVSFGNFTDTYTLPYNGSVVATNFFVEVDAPGYLTFTSGASGDPNTGALLGNIVVDGYESLPNTTPLGGLAPEPSSWVLLATGLLALMGLAQRKFSAGQI